MRIACEYLPLCIELCFLAKQTLHDVSRSSSGKELDGIKILVEDAAKVSIASSADLIGKIKSLDKKTYIVPGVAFTPAQVTVTPFFMKKSGEIYYCENAKADQLAVSP